MKFLKFFLCLFTIFFLYSASVFSFSNSLYYPNKSVPIHHWLIDFALSKDDSIIYALDTISPFPDDSVLYVADGQSGDVIKRIQLPSASYQLGITPDHKKAYIARDGGLSSVNLDTNKISLISTDPLRTDYSFLITKDGQTLYEAEGDYSPNNESNPASIYIISTKFDTIEAKITKQIHKKAGFRRMAFHDDEKKIYLAEAGFDTPCSLAVLDTEKKQLHEQIDIDDTKTAVITEILFDKLHNFLYIILLDIHHNISQVLVINAANYKVVKIISVASRAVHGALSYGNKKLYITTRDNKTVSIIDLADLKLIKTLKVGHNPLAVHPSHDGKKIYIGNASDFSISVIDTQTDEVIDTINLKMNNHPSNN